jgi:putative transcriptional regulator
MIRYYKLFDLLNRRGMKKTDLKEILSSKTIAKLSKGEYLSGEAIEKICTFLHCQPGDIMEVIETEEIDENTRIITKYSDIDGTTFTKVEEYSETKPGNITYAEADEKEITNRQSLNESIK